MRTWIIFHCPTDDCHIVCKLEKNVATGVAECPDMKTAEIVMAAMVERDRNRDIEFVTPSRALAAHMFTDIFGGKEIDFIVDPKLAPGEFRCYKTGENAARDSCDADPDTTL